MMGQFNSKVVGATMIGFALVSGAFVMSNLSKPTPSTQYANLQVDQTTRVPIMVADSDSDGIEDWRDDFVVADPVILNRSTSTYTPPDTLTGQMSTGFMENYIQSKTSGPFGRTKDEVISDTVSNLGNLTEMELYDLLDIDIIKDWDDEDIVNYANTVAATIQRYNNPDLEHELIILRDIVQGGNKDRLGELATLSEIYRNYRDDTLKIPAPAFLVKEHLDLLNTYQAIYTDLEAMTEVINDPALALLRLKRYEDDALGLGYAMQNMFFILEPHAALFNVDDPAILFVLFSPYYTSS